MKIAVWIVQILVALWNITGGFYVINNYDSVVTKWALHSLPHVFWLLFGLLQLLCGVSLLVLGWVKRLSYLVPIAASVLVLISLLGIVFYMSYSGFPGVLWGILPALLAAYIAYTRTKKS